MASPPPPLGTTRVTSRGQRLIRCQIPSSNTSAHTWLRCARCDCHFYGSDTNERRVDMAAAESQRARSQSARAEIQLQTWHIDADAVHYRAEIRRLLGAAG